MLGRLAPSETTEWPTLVLFWLRESDIEPGLKAKVTRDPALHSPVPIRPAPPDVIEQAGDSCVSALGFTARRCGGQKEIVRTVAVLLVVGRACEPAGEAAHIPPRHGLLHELVVQVVDEHPRRRCRRIAGDTAAHRHRPRARFRGSTLAAEESSTEYSTLDRALELYS
eukprot:scaffold202317_cov36-Tisochrysis_lutea.AAC.3